MPRRRPVSYCLLESSWPHCLPGTLKPFRIQWSNTERYAFPFFLRAHNSAVLDTYRLHSLIINNLIAVGELQYIAHVTARELEQITDQQYKISAIRLTLEVLHSQSGSSSVT
jgi:hypothetical protein